jgi:hypothetical protein
MIPAAVAQTLNERAGRDRLSGRVLLLRTCQPCGRSSLGFTWPLQIGAEVNAPDWDPRDCCGYGLHGLPWGEGNGRLLNWSADVVWLVWSAPSDSVVEITEGGGGKAKAPRGRIEHVGDRASATAYLAEHGRPGSAIVGGTSTSGDRGTSVSGYGGTVQGGPGAVLILQWYGGGVYRRASVVVGDGGIKPDTRYRVNNRGEWLEVEE